MKLLVLLLGAAVLALASSAVIDPVGNDINDVDQDESFLVEDEKNDEILDISDDDDDDVDEDGPDEIDDDTEIDGIPLRYLSTEEIYDLLDEDDNMLMSELDIIVAGKIVKARQEGEIDTELDDVKAVKGDRQKRWVPIAVRLLQAGRALFRGSRAGRVTTSGSRVTRQYDRTGNLGTANRDFDRFRVDNPSSFSGRVSGRTGTVGNHRVTVRDGSSSGRPTLEIRSPRQNGGEYVRKFRYDQ